MTRASTVCARGGRAQNPTELADLISAAEALDRPLDHLSKQMCHELRTPLNAVIGFSDVMRREMLGPVGNARYREYLDHISDSARRLLKAAEDTLAIAALLAAPTTIRIQPLNLHDTVSDALTQATGPDPALTSGNAMGITDDIEVWGDRETLLSALTHVFNAARQATRSEQLSLTTQSCSSNVTLTIRAGHIEHQPPPGLVFDPPDQSESDLMLLLARALLRAQGADIDYAMADSDDWHAHLQFEVSRQRAMAF